MIKKIILAFGAHPDDVEIGMGGALARFTSEGHDVFIIVATNPGKPVRKIESEAAAEVLGAKLLFLDIDPDEFSFNRKFVKQFDEIIGDLYPTDIFTHWFGDSHQDHQTLTKIVQASLRKNEQSLYMYEQTLPSGIGGSRFNSQYYVDISNSLDEKLASIAAHETQVHRNGIDWLDSVKARAKYRGFQINKTYAEAFEVIKFIEQY